RALRAARLPGKEADRRLRAALHSWDLDPWRSVPLRALPSSVLQRARLAVPWACPGDAWLMDNPCSLLEPGWKEALPALVDEWRKREGGAVVMATGTPDEAASAGRVAIMHQGRLAACNTPERLCRVSGAEE